MNNADEMHCNQENKAIVLMAIDRGKKYKYVVDYLKIFNYFLSAFIMRLKKFWRIYMKIFESSKKI